MGTVIDMSGNRYGRLVVLGLAEERRNKHRCWRCRCDCGNTVVIQGYTLRYGGSRSCGCLQRELTAERSFKHGHRPAGTPSPTYTCWCNMIARCENPNATRYAVWGGRGITVSRRWRKSFAAFLADMGPQPPGATIDRIDNDKGYSKSNCRWLPRGENTRHR